MEIVKLLNNLIKYKTVYGNNKQFEKCFDYIKNYLSDSNLEIKELKYNNNISLVITNTKDTNFDVIFCGHIDVVPGEDKQFKSKLIKNRLYGRGSYDMKGNDAVMINLIKEYHNSDKKIALFLTSDEEHGGFYGTKKILENYNYNAKLAIVPDAGKDFELITEEKGVLQLKISIKGKEAHSSQLWKGINANTELIDFYNKLIKIYKQPKNEKDWKTSINLAQFHGGEVGNINKVPSKAYIVLDIRHIPKDSKENILKNINRINKNLKIEELARGEDFKVDIENKYAKMYINSCEKVLLKKIKTRKCESSSDARFFNNKNIPCILMNPKGRNAHGKNEFVDITSLEKLYDIYKNILNEL